MIPIWGNTVGTGINKENLENKVTSVNNKTGDVNLTAKDVKALSQDELQSGVNLALQQAKESGEFNGKDGKDGKDGLNGNDYVLTESDKQEIADMIPVPEGNGGGEWRLIQAFEAEQMINSFTINIDEFEATEVYFKGSIGSDVANSGVDGDTLKIIFGDDSGKFITMYAIKIPTDKVTVNWSLSGYSNGAFALVYSQGGGNHGCVIYGHDTKNSGLLPKIKRITFVCDYSKGMLMAGSAVSVYAR